MISYDLSDYGLKMWHQKCHRFFFFITAYTHTCLTPLLPFTAHSTHRYTRIVSQQLHFSKTRKRNKKQPICKKAEASGTYIDTQEMTSQSTGNGRL